MLKISSSLLRRVSGGDIDAFEEVYKASSGFIYNVALRVTQNSYDAQEVTQDVFMKIYHNLKYFDFRSSFTTWAYRITVNTAINKYKVSARDRQRNLSCEGEEITLSDGGKAKEFINKEDDKARIESLLSVLSPELRSCIVLREIEGLDYKEMAKILKIPLNTVRTRLKRAREALLAYAEEGGGKS